MDRKIALLGGILVIVIVAILFQSMNDNKSPETTSSALPSESGSEQQPAMQQDSDPMKQYDQKPPLTIDLQQDYTAVIHTNKGDVTVELTAEETPVTVNNFIFLAKEGYYDGVIFHRVIKDFMIQGGDPTGTGRGGPGYTFEDETTPEQAFDKPGILAMANAGPDTNGSQFFITHGPAVWLNGNHTIFGYVTSGMDVVDAIANVKTERERPVEDIVIKSITVKP